MATLFCSDCNSLLDVEYVEPTYGHTEAGSVPLPTHDHVPRVSLGEGNTPIVKLPRMARILGIQHLYAKLEFLNPTGSFKDRGAAVMLSVAKENGIKTVLEDSSGNAGASVAAYAARGGIQAHIFVLSSAPVPKIRQIQAYGATVHLVEGTRESVSEAAVLFHHERQMIYASHVMSPYFAEGTKTFAYELVAQLVNSLPDHVVFPIGNGSLLIGTWKGLVEQRDTGRLVRIPRLHCVQAQQIAPIVAAFAGGPCVSQDTQSTVARGIAVASPARLDQILHVLRESNGDAAAVDDASILTMQQELSEREGVFAEPTSAAVFAGINILVERGVIGAGDTVLVPVTGSGLKSGEPITTCETES